MRKREPRERGMAYRPDPVWKFHELTRFLPERGYIRDYVEYAIQCTDAPPLYHILAATAVVSAAVAPNLDFYFEGEMHPLHLYILLVGDSSESRKTSAIKRAVRVAEPVFEKISMRGPRLWWPIVSSPEGITEELGKEPNRLMLLSEWTEMHRLSSRAGYWQHASEFWNLLYDALDASRSRSKVQIQITRPRVSILAASTPSLIEHATTPVDWLGGKLARYLIGCASRPADVEMDAAVDLPDTVAALRGALGILVNPSLPTGGAADGKASLLPESWQILRDWGRGDWWRDLKARTPAHLKPSFSRAQEHVFRVSTLFQASMSYPFKVEVSPANMRAAIAVVEWCFTQMTKTFMLLHDENLSALGKVTAVLSAAGQAGMSRTALLRKTRLSARAVNEAVGTLVERGDLVGTPEVSHGRAGVRYVYSCGAQPDE